MIEKKIDLDYWSKNGRRSRRIFIELDFWMIRYSDYKQFRIGVTEKCVKNKNNIGKLGSVIIIMYFRFHPFHSIRFPCAHEKHLVRFFHFFRIQKESKPAMLKIYFHQGSQKEEKIRCAVANVNIGPLARVVTFSVIMETGNIIGNFTSHVIFGNLHSKDESFRGCGGFFEVVE